MDANLAIEEQKNPPKNLEGLNIGFWLKLV
jgi:hypothetical protein